MTDREKRIRLKIRTANAEAKAGLGRLRDALLAGEPTGPIRAEIDAFLLRAAQGEDELAEVATAFGRVRDQRLWTLAGALATATTAKIDSTVARLRPAAKPNAGDQK
jgi:hypothetical protein